MNRLAISRLEPEGDAEARSGQAVQIHSRRQLDNRERDRGAHLKRFTTLYPELESFWNPIVFYQAGFTPRGVYVTLIITNPFVIRGPALLLLLYPTCVACDCS